MASENRQRMKKEILVNDLNSYLTCTLCGGYFIDATTLVECLHVFCRGCILKYFENSKIGCPTCNTVYKKKSPIFRSDPQLQALVYKMVPGLYSKEIQRREEFYRSSGVRASSSCSEDSVLGDLKQDLDEWVSSNNESSNKPQNQYFSPDDSISLSLEYYQFHLDHTKTDSTKLSALRLAKDTVLSDGKCELLKLERTPGKSETDGAASEERVKDRRYLQCPAAVSMSHLQKFLRMKYALSPEHKVDIIYEGEILPSYYNLMDVAYTFNWSKTKPMRFFYRIFTPMKIQPIKIINTSTPTGGKQLQIVPVKPNPEIPKPPEPTETTESTETADLEAQNYKNKERLMAHLKLQSKHKPMKSDKIDKHKVEPNCVYEYDKPDEEERKRFAEKRDREWALQMKSYLIVKEEGTEKERTKKRKKSKHKSDGAKKRKLHAEITSEVKDESIKLKVKLKPHNGHKHKHHRLSQVIEKSEVSSKEKLSQMRSVRHKSSSSTEEKSGIESPECIEEPIPIPKPPAPQLALIKADMSNLSKTLRSDFTIKPNVNKEATDKQAKQTFLKTFQSHSNRSNKVPTEKITSHKNEVTKKPVNTYSNQNKSNTLTNKSSAEAIRSNTPTNKLAPETNKSVSSQNKITVQNKANKLGQINNKSVNKSVASQAIKNVTAQTNKSVTTQANKTVTVLANKTVIPQATKNVNALVNKTVPQHLSKSSQAKVSNWPQQSKTSLANKSLEKKIATLQQQCTIEPKQAEKTDKKLSFGTDQPRILNSQQYPTGFTVSKIETGVKRKTDSQDALTNQPPDKRPSLEITLINPMVETPAPSPTQTTKRPPPATIPLERIKKSINKSGVSIIPKLPDKCDNIGALDLSKPHKLNGITTLNGMKTINNKLPEKTPQLSNLQMLSKVATEHPTINKTLLNAQKVRPQLPNLQTLKIPVVSPPPANKSPAFVSKNIPKLNEINKSQFRLLNNAQVRSMRPTQNQNIRNIPNPSLLVRQQIQNRLNAVSLQNGDAKEQTILNSGAPNKDEKRDEVKKLENGLTNNTGLPVSNKS